MVVRDSQPRFNLSNDIRIERLDEQFAKNIQKACEPPHHDIDPAISGHSTRGCIRRSSQLYTAKSPVYSGVLREACQNTPANLPVCYPNMIDVYLFNTIVISRLQLANLALA
jgi:hypothetical protein